MQLTAKGGNMVVDFYPIKGSTKFMLKVVKFNVIFSVKLLLASMVLVMM